MFVITLQDVIGIITWGIALVFCLILIIVSKIKEFRKKHRKIKKCED